MDELDAIAQGADAQLAAQAVVPGAAPAAQPEQPPGPDQAAQIGGILTMGVMMAAPALPFLPACYTPDVIGNIATAAAAVCEKHGWNVGDVMSPELVLAVAVLPPSVQAFVMFKQWRSQKAEEAARAANQAARATQHSDHGQASMLPALPAPVA